MMRGHDRSRRSRWRFAARGIALGVAVALPVSADQPPGAPPGQYESFDFSSTRIRDLKTRLTWERSASAAVVTFAAAKCPPPTRLPTLKELLTLVDEQPHLDYDVNLLRNVEKMIDPQAFGAETPVNAAYWTSSITGDRVWTVDFRTGETNTDAKTATNYFRCVSFAP